MHSSDFRRALLDQLARIRAGVLYADDADLAAIAPGLRAAEKAIDASTRKRSPATIDNKKYRDEWR